MSDTTSLIVINYLEYANLQMAAEAFLVNQEKVVENGAALIRALERGNDHASKFTETQAKEFDDNWTIVSQEENSPTGFSGTLFKRIKDDPLTGAKAGELVMSFRSTEFIDDSARDNKATNTLEVSASGFAFGQIRDMEAWYDQLTSSGLIPPGEQFSVTGYSLGGHLATAFNMLHNADGVIKQVVTFNAAGVGAIKDGTNLQAVMDRFTALSTDTSGTQFNFSDAGLAALYQKIRVDINGGKAASAADMTELLAHGE